MGAVNIAQLADWTPARISWERSAPVLHWCCLGRERFVEPFFEQTISKRLRVPFNLLFQHATPLDALVELQAVDPGLPPTGFIFHMSRCGSTLAAQLLAALPQNIVISEAGPVDALLRCGLHAPSISRAQQIAWLQALLSAYARPHHGEKHFYVKFDSWHTLALPLIQEAFPTVPWIFLYRDPVQVLVSHQRQRGAQMVPGQLPAEWLGLEALPAGAASLDEYCARVLERICNAASQHLNDRVRLISYHQLPAAVWTEIATHCGVEYSAADCAAMHETAHFDAKNPSLTFAPDTENKESVASADLRRLADARLLPVYTALEARRKLQKARAGAQA